MRRGSRHYPHGLRGESSAIDQGDRMLFDYQGNEIDRIALEAHANEFAKEGDAVFAFHPEWGQASLEVAEGLNLVGSTARHFGHWILEYLLRWITFRELDDLAEMPVLIDERLAPTHREALEYFSESRVEIIIVPADTIVHVRRLWAVANWIYVPIYWKNEQAIDVGSLVWPVDEVASRYERLSRRIDRDLVEWNGPERVFLGRRETLHRKLTNVAQIEALARARNFQVVYPEDLSFRDQMRLVRSATHVMGPEGSALFLACFARPGTKLCAFDHPFVEKSGFIAALFAARGIDSVLLTGECAKKDPLFPRFSDYTIDQGDVRALFDEWKLHP